MKEPIEKWKEYRVGEYSKKVGEFTLLCSHMSQNRYYCRILLFGRLAWFEKTESRDPHGYCEEKLREILATAKEIIR